MIISLAKCMNEEILVHISLVCAIIGFIGLFLLSTLQKPLQMTEPIQNTLIEQRVFITNLRETATGTLLTYTTKQTGYIDKKAELSKTIINQSAKIRGRYTTEGFTIESIEVLAPDDHS